jgi:hypothetical protein
MPPRNNNYGGKQQQQQNHHASAHKPTFDLVAARHAAPSSSATSAASESNHGLMLSPFCLGDMTAAVSAAPVAAGSFPSGNGIVSPLNRSFNAGGGGGGGHPHHPHPSPVASIARCSLHVLVCSLHPFAPASTSDLTRVHQTTN